MGKQKNFGSVDKKAPTGFLPRRVHFATLVQLDTPTKEGFLTRIIESAGFGTRELPLTIDGMAPERGHAGSVPVGRLDAIRIDGANVEGWGWLADTDAGRAAFQELDLKILRGNSIKMTDVKVKVKFDFGEEDDDDLSIIANFTESKLGATTLVMTPAFGAANAELEDIAASLAIEEDLEVTAAFEVDFGDDEVMAAAGVLLDHEAFQVAEPETYQTIAISRDARRVSGHLGRWNTPHAGFINRFVSIPRSKTNYAHFCKSPQPTTKGTAYTGPLVLIGGHEATAEIITKALADVKNAWADVVVTDGKIGPWMCGVLRPGLTEEALAAARGSRISGHWRNGELYAVCSVNAEGFDVPRATEFQVETDEDGEIIEMAASFGLLEEAVSPAPSSRPLDQAELGQQVAAALAAAREALEV